MTVRREDSASFSVRYRWPEDGRARLDTSPSTHTDGTADSISSLSADVSSWIVRMRTPGGGNTALMNTHLRGGNARSGYTGSLRGNKVRTGCRPPRTEVRGC